MSLDMPGMDDGRKTLVKLLGLVYAATDTSLVLRWRDVVQHASGVFERENRWMRMTQFSSAHIHSTQHKVVLQVMQEGLSAGESGDLAVTRKMVYVLGQWFANRSQSMDAAVALHLRSVDYEPITGVLSMPDDIAPVFTPRNTGTVRR